MNHKVIVFGGWAIDTSIFNPIFGSRAGYIDINRFMLSLIKNDRLIPNWKEKLIELAFPEEHKSFTLIGWSTGAIAALAIAPLTKVSRLILLSATPSFCRRTDFHYGTKPSILNKMINSLKEYPTPVLQQFYKECGFEEHAINYENYSKEELIAGLQFLQQVSLLPLSPVHCPVNCFHGTDDRIIPAGAGKYLCDKICGEWSQYEGSHVFFNKEEVKIRLKDIVC